MPVPPLNVMPHLQAVDVAYIDNVQVALHYVNLMAYEAHRAE